MSIVFCLTFPFISDVLFDPSICLSNLILSTISLISQGSNSNQCLIGIENVEILKMNEHEIELLIYHNGTMDSENPYRYKLENDNLW